MKTKNKAVKRKLPFDYDLMNLTKRPHSEALNKIRDDCVHNVSQYTSTHEYGHGSASNKMNEIVSKPLVVRQIAEMNGNIDNITAGKILRYVGSFEANGY
uniref:Uncharacterized protein n=1 Tax=Tanacetum cinerariifolium TaxID=118510 RepID=A0A699K197_TANCI|nr:hypothetical protein [Tanacetum cinerariifolium]